MPEHQPDTPPVLDIIALDDDEDFLEFVSALLTDRGHTVRTASAAPDCLSLCESRLPDIVLLDMHMGHHSGQQVLEHLHDRWPKLCIIIVTGYPSMDTMRETFKRDAFDYLAKPFSAEQLDRVLMQAAETFALGLRPQDRLRQRLGQRIRMERADRKWTLKELSEHAGVSVSQLSSIERGTHLPSLDSLLLIATALDTKPSAWLAETGF